MRSASPGAQASAIFDYFNEKFETLVDDFPNMAVSGTVTDPGNLVDNDPNLRPVWDTVNEYVDLTWEGSVYITELRHRGTSDNNEDGLARLRAFIEGIWVDALVGIGTVLAVWSDWIPLTTPMASNIWRFEVTTLDSGVNHNDFAELWLKGIKWG